MKLRTLLPAQILLVLAAATANGSAAEPAAASAAFTSTDAIVEKALQLVNSGRLQKAETLLNLNTNSADAATARARQETLDIIHRIRIEYSLKPADLLGKLRKSVPNATAKDAERWAKQSKARCRIIDGRKFYFRREPSNIFRFSEEARNRRDEAGNAPPEPKWKLIDHLQAVVDEAGKTGKDQVQPVRHHITCTVTIRTNSGVKAGSLVRAWLPYPQEYRQQSEVKLISASPEPKQVAPNGIDGKPVSGGAQRTVYFEQRVTDPTQPIQFQEVFEYTSFAFYPTLDESKAQPLPPDWGGACLEQRPPHIVFTAPLRSLAARIVGEETNPLAKARRIFRWVSANIKWNAEDEYCIIPSLVLKGITAGRGDCGIQSTVFVTLCRIAGIPARWQSGFETKPGGSWGMHDWSEIYIAPWGWLPADASYGVQKSDDPRIADFYCGHQDSYRLIVNLDWGRELFPPKSALRSEPADLQRGEVEVDGRNLYFDQWEFSIKAQLDPGPSPE